MAKKKTKKTTEEEQSALGIATLLAEVRARMAVDKALDKTLTEALKKALEREQITHAGNYKRDTATSFKVVEEKLALPFAMERGLVKISTADVHELFRRDVTLRFEDPARYGFASTTTTKIVPIRKSSSQQEEE